MSRCDQELCQHWTGEGCACAVLDIDRASRDCMPCTYGDCASCTAVVSGNGAADCCCSGVSS